MGTNYYYRYNICMECGRYDELHIGKASYGWKFGFQAHYEPKIKSYADWVCFFTENKGDIYDEYGKIVYPADFARMVYKRKEAKLSRLGDGIIFIDREHNEFTYTEFS